MYFYDSTNCKETVMGNQNSLIQVSAFALLFLDCSVTMLE